MSPAFQVKAEALEDDELDVANDLSGSDNMEPQDMNNAQIENELCLTWFQREKARNCHRTRQLFLLLPTVQLLQPSVRVGLA